MRALIADDEGSSPVEFVLVGTLLTVLTLAVLQLGLSVYVRNVVHDAAVEGAYHAALADVPTTQGAVRAEAIVARSVGDGIVQSAAARESIRLGHATIEVTVVATLPLLGLLGLPGALEVTGHAPVETLG